MANIDLTDDSASAAGVRTGSGPGGRLLGFVPLVIALVITLVLGGASVARSLTLQSLDAATDLEFSLDGSTWLDEPALVLGSWGCDLGGGTVVPDPDGAIGGTTGVDPCAMSPGEYIDRTYYVRNATDTGRIGEYAVGIGEFELSGEAEFTVSSAITGNTGSDDGEVTLYGEETPQAGLTPASETTLAALALAPGASARVVDTVAVPANPLNYERHQSASPRMWVSFADTELIDTDRDGLPDVVESELGTDPDDPFNSLPVGVVGENYGPENFLPITPDGTVLDVDLDTLPPGVRPEDGQLVGTPTRSGVYDIEFTVTMPDGSQYTSIRRLEVIRDGGGSGSLPGIGWPIGIGIGVIIGIIISDAGSSTGSVISSAVGSSGGSGSGAGSSGGSAGGSQGGSTGGSSDSSGAGSDSTDSDAGTVGSLGTAALGSLGSVTAAVNGAVDSVAGSLTGESDNDSTGSGVSAGPAGPGGEPPEDSGATPGGTNGGATAGTSGNSTSGQVSAEQVTPREAAPSDEWNRANSEVRSSLPTTGVGAAELLLWALTAAAAGVTLILLARRRRTRDGS